jgi:hypothetical protein
MAEPTLPYTLTNGTTANASEVQQNDQALLDAITDGTKDIEVAALTTLGSVTLGNSSVDTVTWNGSLASHVLPSANTTHNIGSATLGLLSVYIGGSSTFTTRLLGGTQTGSHTLTLPTALPSAAPAALVTTDTSGTLAFSPRSINATAKTTTYPIVAADYVLLFDVSGGTFTTTLPTAVGAAGKEYILKKTDSSLTHVTIATTSAQTIDGASTATLYTQYESIRVMSNGANWEVIERRIPSVWTAYTPTCNATTNATTTGKWRRSGDGLDVQCKVAFSGANTNAATVTFTIPNSSVWTIDTGKITDASTKVFGQGVVHATAGSDYHCTVGYSSTTAITLKLLATGGTHSEVTSVNPTANIPAVIASGDYFDCTFWVPITGFGG